MEKFAEQLAELARHWNRVESRIKEYEHLAGATNAAAINELRYAGRRLIDAVALIAANPDDPKIGEEFLIASNYIVNADHDVTDGLCFVVMRHVAQVIQVHGLPKIKRYVPDFPTMYPAVAEAQEIIRHSREHRPDRKADYQKLASDYLPKLKQLYQALTSTPKLAVTSDDIKRLETGVSVLALFTIFGALFSFLALILTLVAWAYPTSYWTIFWSIF